MSVVHSKHARTPLQSLKTAAVVSLAVVVYSYIQHKRTAEKARKSMSTIAALSTASMANLRGANAYGAGQWTEADEREQRFDKDAAFFPASLIDKEATATTSSAKDKKDNSSGSGKLDKVFLLQLRALARIIIPSLASKEVIIIVMHTMFLVLRTWLSVVVAELDGKIVKHLVRGQGRKFLAGLLSWFAIAVPATYTNSMIRFLESKLALAFRTRLTQYVHDLYLNDNLTYYKLLTLDGRISNADQFITTDIARFCNKLASFLSNLGKPTLDTIIFNIQLVRGVGLQGTIGMFGMYMATASLLRAWTPAFGKMAAARAKLEGEFRANHSRIITNAEEIAFYRGEKREGEQLDFSLRSLLSHVRSVARRKIPHVVLEDMIIKYTWSAFGYLACALPFFLSSALPGVGPMAGGSGGDAGDSGHRTQRFITNKRILVNLSDAGGRVMYSIKEIMELTGYTSRVYSLISTLHALRREEYEQPPPSDTASSQQGLDFVSSKIRGVLYEDIDGVRFTSVPIVAPSTDPGISGELLVQPLTWEVQRGQHWMIAGPNGVGKTSVLRVLSGLWPVFSGVVERPEPAEIIYIPQRPYLPLGSLREQIIYPHTPEQMQALGRTDEELLEVLYAVHLGYLPAREGGLGAHKEWKDVLSGGEKQRINLARLFYHLPRFAVLDECTSAVSADVEGLMYEHAKKLGITLITISHRPTLYKYHTYLLRLGVNEASPGVQSGSTLSSVVLNEEDSEISSSQLDGDIALYDSGGSSNASSNGGASNGMSMSTESWESNFGNMSSLEDVVSSGVVWDVVQLPSAASVAESTASTSTESNSALNDPISSLLPQQRPALTRRVSTTSAAVSTVDIVREGSIAAIRHEMVQLRDVLAAKKLQEADLKARLNQVQQELSMVVT
ncbi:ATP-binding cassette long-chain fatty acid transporter pxa1 [Coemansia sp. RSA 1813]|nr:ATP-binding cassette long-chain fatty acid transporter pxa1 [Coemansia sp. RSA 1646]KAJ1769621.1 ATP-binding cassette long-chain fatty acid transporter pxa1 [Coemansia sp. RSA 1843]KAJ2091006.1 ATP-binding cassette long-chain fatty acid transporter pxa1 [Coemansia sp. RSA 986]KAJ2215917.1 ATP-binding cassette long-chain fatty acid transporter pxa1 [Coemansia sp. RSA 487]KAJ2570241.1 ATP-binding cassette long-chain fatty acid transporter pxa1 [Coemansia sp. RSA 1813]